MPDASPLAADFKVSLRRSGRARRPTLRVRPGRPPEVVLPLRAPASAANQLLRENEIWLREKLLWAEGVERQAEALGLLRPGLIWLDGRASTIVAAGAPAADEAALERWCRERARTTLVAESERIWGELNERGLLARRPGRISIRDQRSRWASCSAKGNLSYSWRLAMMPPAARQYVVAHELCHLEQLNHSRRFWDLLSEARPGWRAEAAWIREYGPLIALHRPRPAPSDGAFEPLPSQLPAPSGTGYLELCGSLSPR